MHGNCFGALQWIKDYQVSLLTNFQGANLIFKTYCPRPVDGCQFQNLLRGNCQGIFRCDLMLQCCKFHQLYHILGIVAGGAVYAKADIDSSFQHLRYRGHSGRQIHIGAYIVGNLDVVLLCHVHICVSQIAAVYHQYVWPYDAKFLQKRCVI